MIKIWVFLAAVVACNADAPVTPPIRCGLTPAKLLPCLGNERLVSRDVTSQCSRSVSECARMKCIFEKSGWMKGQNVDKAKVIAYFDQYAKDHPSWAAAVQAVKTDCLSTDLPPQGAVLNCPTFDIMHCAITRFVKNAQPAQWSSSAECEYPRQFAASCPLCPEDCFATMIPTGSCQACVLLPRSP